ncbi:uncharacterized protein LOC123667775, partial [Melitaea cinxia]|uniref:uncharacterized protein LOC123667775 n=1 Tax=Melitaea cinxia TaxID=113334 RepID=UPI001E272E3C
VRGGLGAARARVLLPLHHRHRHGQRAHRVPRRAPDHPRARPLRHRPLLNIGSWWARRGARASATSTSPPPPTRTTCAPCSATCTRSSSRTSSPTSASIKHRFVVGSARRARECYFHFTTATDTDNVRTVFRDVHQIILAHVLSDIGLY